MRTIAMVVLLASCGSKKEAPADKGSTLAPLPDGFVAHPNHPKLIIKTPADAKPVDNQLGVGWFENADKSFAITYRPDESADTMETVKSTISRVVKTWLKETQTPDGYILTFTTDIGGKLEHGLDMRRTVDGKPWRCTAGTMRDEAGLQVVIDACNTLRSR